MPSNRLQLNTDKTKLIWRVTSRLFLQLQSTSIRVGSETITPSSTDRDLGVYIDSDLSMWLHVQWTALAGCFAALWQIRSVRRSLPPTMLETLVSLVLTQLDYAIASLAGIHTSNLLRGHVLKWLASFVTDRTQAIVFDGTTSSPVKLDVASP